MRQQHRFWQWYSWKNNLRDWKRVKGNIGQIKCLGRSVSRRPRVHFAPEFEENNRRLISLKRPLSWKFNHSCRPFFGLSYDTTPVNRRDDDKRPRLRSMMRQWSWMKRRNRPSWNSMRRVVSDEYRRLMMLRLLWGSAWRGQQEPELPWAPKGRIDCEGGAGRWGTSNHCGRFLRPFILKRCTSGRKISPRRIKIIEILKVLTKQCWRRDAIKPFRWSRYWREFFPERRRKLSDATTYRSFHYQKWTHLNYN